MGKKEAAAAITEIDQDHLDVECVKLPSDYRHHAFLAAEAKRDVQEAKAYLDVVSAEVGMKIRKDPGSFGVLKITETSLTAMVILQAEYQEAQKTYFRALHHSEMSQAVVWALEHKKRSLTLLVELHGLGYFADVKASTAGKQAVEETSKQNVRRRHQPRKDED